jgi:hypothetical protein
MHRQYTRLVTVRAGGRGSSKSSAAERRARRAEPGNPDSKRDNESGCSTKFARVTSETVGKFCELSQWHTRRN